MARSLKANGPPYGPPGNIKTILEFWRERTMPEQVTKDWLTRIGLSANLAPHNLSALRFLELIDENGYPTEKAEMLRVAPSDKYSATLENIIRHAYARFFEVTDPSQDSKNRISDAFRQEQPSAQRMRMVSFFLGICAFAGIPLKESPPSRTPSNRVGQPRKAKGMSPETAPPRIASVHVTTPSAVALPPAKARRLPDVIQGWIDRMPAEGETWNRSDFQKWLKMFSGSIEVLYNIEETEPPF